MANIKIKKADGHMVPFDPAKVKASIKKTGADNQTADEIIKVVKGELTSGMTTAAVYDIVRQELKNRKPWAAARYNLREAIIRMGPAGFNFEKYVSSILTAYGYRTVLPEMYDGACIPHEIDVAAEKEGRSAFIEAKFRHSFRSTIVIKDVLATWARFLDLVDGSKIGTCPHFDEAWIVTNARFTDQSLRYGHCKNMVLIGWNHPRERTFAQMVDLNALYPITVLDVLTEKELAAFANTNLMLCRDIEATPQAELMEMTGIGAEKLKELTRLCKQVIHGG